MTSTSGSAIRHVVLDLDGTLISGADHRDAWDHALAPYGLDADEILPVIFADPLIPAGRVLHERYGLPAGAGADLIDAFAAFCMPLDSGALPGAAQLIADLHGLGARLYVSSFSPTALVARRVEQLGAGDLVGLALGSCDRAPSSKAVNHFQAIRDHAQVTDEQFAACGACVGDSPSDMVLGERERLAVRVGVNLGGDQRRGRDLVAAGATCVVDALEEVPVALGLADHPLASIR